MCLAVELPRRKTVSSSKKMEINHQQIVFKIYAEFRNILSFVSALNGAI